MSVVIQPANTRVVVARFSGLPVGGGGSGTVTSVSVVTANGVSGTVATATTTPAITIVLGAITPSSIVASGNITGLNLSGTNTGDQDLSGLVVANVAITGATKTKITYDAKGLVTAGADATTADIADSLNKRYVTDAHLVILGNTSNTNTGDQTITLTGDVTGTGTGSFATTIANNAVTTIKILDSNVTLAKIANIADLTFLGNNTGGAAAPVALTVANAKTMLGLAGTNSGDVTLAGENYLSIAGQVITANAVNLSGTHVTGDLPFANLAQVAAVSLLGNPTGVLADASAITLGAGLQFSGTTIVNTITQYTDEMAQDAIGAMIDTSLVYVDATPLLQRAALTGDVTASAGSNATTIANDAVTTVKILNANVTYAKIQNVTQARLLGRYTASDGVVQEITIGTGLALDAGTGILTATGGGGGTPGGADTQIQYNDGGAFGGTPSLVYNDTTDVFTFGTYVGGATFVTVNASGNSAYSLKAISSGIGGIAFDATASGASGTAIQISATNSSGLGAVVSTTGGVAIGVTTTGGQLFTGTVTNATTNIATDVVATFGHNSSGAVANNFGARIEFQLESSTTADQTAGYIQWDWSTATHASRASFIRFFSTNGGTNPEMLRLGGGSAQVTFPQLGSGILQVSSGVLAAVSLSAGRIMYGSGGGLIASASNLTYSDANIYLGVGLGTAVITAAHALHVANTPASTDTVHDIACFHRGSSGTGASGIGAGVKFTVETTTTNNTDAGRIATYWVDATHASRTSAITFSTVDNAGALTERFRVGGLACKFTSGVQHNVLAKTADYTMLESDDTITSDATAGVVTITLPAATTKARVFIKRIDASANNTTVSRAGSDTIEGNNTLTLAAQWESVTLQADGTATWLIISTT